MSQQFQDVGIGVNLVYVSFTVLIDRLFPSSCPCGQPYDQGGFDVAFIGHGGGAPLPDFRLLTGYHSEVGAPLNNYALYKNTTVDALIDKYQTDFNTTDRLLTGQQIVRMTAQDRPMPTIYYSADQFIWKNYISPWKQQSVYTTSELPDVEHWAMPGHTTANIGVTGDLDSINYLASSASNTIYDLWMYGDLLSGLEYLNPIDLTYHNALATSIVPNTAHTEYTITFRPNQWSDGQPVTSDDFLYWMEASLNAAGTSVNLGNYQSILGLGTAFKWLNGTTTATFNSTSYASPTAPGVKYINSTYTALSPTSFKFTVPTPYIFTDPILTGISPLPKHILEQYPEGTWDTMFGSISDNTPKTLHWAANPSEFVTAGTFSALNYMVGNGPYLWNGYNPTASTAELVKNPSYWNRTGLESIGYYQATTYHVVHIVDKSASLASFAVGTVNMLDTNYQFNINDKANAQGNSGYMTVTAGPGAGSQEFGFNMLNPIFGTGVATPNGINDPAHAATYARDVRHAMSDLVPRQLIIDNLLLGAGVPGVTAMPVSFSSLYPSDVTADPFSPAEAIALLAAAGYGNAGYYYQSYTPPPITPVTIGNTTVTVPSYVVGQAFTFQGAFSVDLAAGAAGNGFAVIMQTTTDNQTWTPQALIQTTSGGGYSYTYAFAATGAQSYRFLLTGIPWSYITANGYATAQKLYQEWDLTTSQHQFLNTTKPIYSQQYNFRVGSLADVVSALGTAQSSGLTSLSDGITSQLNALQTSLANQLNSLGGTVNGINTQLGTLAKSSDLSNTNSQLTNISYIAYAAIAIALILGLVAIFLARKRS